MALSGCVLINEGGPHTVVAHVFHQLAEARARVCGELVAGMAQIVKVDAGQADTGNGGLPHAPVEVAVPHRRAVRASEHEGRGSAEPVKMLTEIGGDEI